MTVHVDVHIVHVRFTIFLHSQNGGGGGGLCVSCVKDGVSACVQFSAKLTQDAAVAQWRHTAIVHDSTL